MAGNDDVVSGNEVGVESCLLNLECSPDAQVQGAHSSFARAPPAMHSATMTRFIQDDGPSRGRAQMVILVSTMLLLGLCERDEDANERKRAKEIKEKCTNATAGQSLTEADVHARPGLWSLNKRWGLQNPQTRSTEKKRRVWTATYYWYVRVVLLEARFIDDLTRNLGACDKYAADNAPLQRHDS